MHCNGNVVILIKSSLLAAIEMGILTSPVAASDENFPTNEHISVFMEFSLHGWINAKKM